MKIEIDVKKCLLCPYHSILEDDGCGGISSPDDYCRILKEIINIPYKEKFPSNCPFINKKNCDNCNWDGDDCSICPYKS